MSPDKNNRWNQWPSSGRPAATTNENNSRRLKFMSDISSPRKTEPLLPIGSEVKANGANQRGPRNTNYAPAPNLHPFLSPEQQQQPGLSTFGRPKSPMFANLVDQRDPIARMTNSRQARNAFHLAMRQQEQNNNDRQRNTQINSSSNQPWFVETNLDHEMVDEDDDDADEHFGLDAPNSPFVEPTNSNRRLRRPIRSKSAQPFMSTFGQASDYEQAPQIIREIRREFVPMYYGQAPAGHIEPFYGGHMFSQGYMMTSGQQPLINPMFQHQQMMQHHAHHANQAAMAQQQQHNLQQLPRPQFPVVQRLPFAPYYQQVRPTHLQTQPSPYSANINANLNEIANMRNQQQQQQTTPKTILKTAQPQVAKQAQQQAYHVLRHPRGPQAPIQASELKSQQNTSNAQKQAKLQPQQTQQKQQPNQDQQQQQQPNQNQQQQEAEPRRSRRRARGKNGARNRGVSEPQHWHRTNSNSTYDVIKQ